MSNRALWILLLAWPALADAAPTLATATIVDGSPTMIRASSKLALVEGARLAAEDIVETGAAAHHLRLEFADGLVLDLGPGTSLQLQPRLAGDAVRKGVRVYLLRGAVKVSAPGKGAAGASPLLASPLVDLPTTKRSAVIVLDTTQAGVFAESGEATLAERRAGKPLGAHLKEGEFFATTANGAGEVSASPRPDFIQRLPKAFLDTLPARAALFRDKEVASAPASALVYADVQPWIDAEPALRGGFVTRWRTLARQGEFRKGLEQGLAAHPEWDRELHPERYLPKPASAPPSAPPSTGKPGTTRY